MFFRIVSLLLLTSPLLFSLGGCRFQPVKTQPVASPTASVVEKPVADPQARARELFAPTETCFLEFKPYCMPIEPDDVDFLIQKVVDASFQGRMPHTEKDIQRLVQQAERNYNFSERKGWPAKQSWQAKAEAKMQSHYQNPDVAVQGRQVMADLGYVPGKIQIQKVHHSEHLEIDSALTNDKNRWQTTEAARVLQKLRQDYPEAEQVAAVVRIYGHRKTRVWWYAYSVDLNQILVYDADSSRPWCPKATKTLTAGFAPFLSGKSSLDYYDGDLKLDCDAKSRVPEKLGHLKFGKGFADIVEDG